MFCVQRRRRGSAWSPRGLVDGARRVSSRGRAHGRQVPHRARPVVLRRGEYLLMLLRVTRMGS